MAQSQQAQSVGRPSNVSTADSGMALLTQNYGASAPNTLGHEKTPLYADLQGYIDQQRRQWVFTRNNELAHPLQQGFLAYEAGLMQEIHEIEHRLESKRERRALEMEGATGIALLSWKLYKLKIKICGRWTKLRLHGSWKHSRLNARKKALCEEYVQAQIGRRLNIIRELMWAASEQGVDGADDGAYVRDNMLNYIVTGYDSIFPLRRKLELDINFGDENFG